MIHGADDIVVTGVGAVTPYGVGVETLWDGVAAGRDAMTRISRFDASHYRSQIAGMCDERVADSSVPARKRKRMDRFSHIGLMAAGEAIRSAGLDIGTSIDSARVGAYVGNVLGGWAFAERELRTLWTAGLREVSPYQATAWFPTSLQGHLCMEFGAKGKSRTIIADRASGAYAMVSAIQALRLGDIDVAVVGGSEAPVSPYGWLCVESSMTVASTGAEVDGRAYRPFQKGHCGSVYSEGSAFLVLERAGHAHARGASPRAIVSGWGRSSDAYLPHFTVEPTGEQYARAIESAIERARLDPADVSAVFAAGTAVPFEDVTESYAIRKAFGGDIPVTVPKSFFGNLLGASVAVDLILAILGAEHGAVPASCLRDDPAPGITVRLTGKPVPVDPNGSICVLSRGLSGCNAALIVTPVQKSRRTP